MKGVGRKISRALKKMRVEAHPVLGVGQALAILLNLCQAQPKWTSNKTNRK